jgi:tRNA threonylcarbamoyladenosine biosynthesis protein TsaE
MKFKIQSDSAEKTQETGRALAQSLRAGCVVGISGELGAGKTQFVKGIAAGLQIDPESVTSPTFTLINEYEGALPLFHFDFYRLETPAALDEIGAEEYFWGEGICVVEWADMFPESLPKRRVDVRIVAVDETKREIEVLVRENAPIDLEKLEKALQS